MSTETQRLKLFKYNPETDGEQPFSISRALNNNWDKIDAGLGNYPTTTEMQTYATQIATEKANAKLTMQGGALVQSGSDVTNSVADLIVNANRAFVTGTYTGTSSSSQTITLGFQPKAVLVYCVDCVSFGSSWAYHTGGLVLPGSPVLYYGNAKWVSAMEITSSGFFVKTASYGNNIPSAELNTSNKRYNYIAFK